MLYEGYHVDIYSNHNLHYFDYRQLLAGVDNLRMMADSLDSVDRIEEKEDQYSHWDDDTGPAL